VLDQAIAVLGAHPQQLLDLEARRAPHAAVEGRKGDEPRTTPRHLEGRGASDLAESLDRHRLVMQRLERGFGGRGHPEPGDEGIERHAFVGLLHELVTLAAGQRLEILVAGAQVGGGQERATLHEGQDFVAVALDRVVALRLGGLDGSFRAAVIHAEDCELVAHRAREQLALALRHVGREARPTGAGRALEIEGDVSIDRLQTQRLHGH
jgi:hypothetical protein